MVRRVPPTVVWTVLLQATARAQRPGIKEGRQAIVMMIQGVARRAVMQIATLVIRIRVRMAIATTQALRAHGV